MKTYGLYESAAVKIQTLKTAIEVGPHPSPPFSPVLSFATFLSFALTPFSPFGVLLSVRDPSPSRFGTFFPFLSSLSQR